MHKDPNDIALMTSKRSLFTCVKELFFSGKKLPDIKPPSFNLDLVNVKIPHWPSTNWTCLNRENWPCMILMINMQGYWKHAYNFQPTDLATVSLISSYIQGITNPHIKRKLRTAKANILQDIFTLALEEDSKTESLSFGVWYQAWHYSSLWHKCHQKHMLQVWQRGTFYSGLPSKSSTVLFTPHTENAHCKSHHIKIAHNHLHLMHLQQ